MSDCNCREGFEAKNEFIRAVFALSKVTYMSGLYHTSYKRCTKLNNLFIDFLDSSVVRCPNHGVLRSTYDRV